MSFIKCSEVIEISAWILKPSGLYPSKITIANIWKLVFNVVLNVIIYQTIVYNIVVAIKTNNSTLLNWETCILFPLANYCSKTGVLIIHRNHFLSILNDLESVEFNSHSKMLNQNIRFVYNITRMLIKFFAYSLIVCLGIFSILPFVTDGLMFIPPAFDTGRFDIVYKIAHLFLSTFVSYIYLGVETLYIALLGLCIAQLNILQEKLSNIFDEPGEEAAIRSLLKECIILHDKINQFVDKLSVVLSLPMFVQYLSGCVMFCYNILQLTIWGDESTARLVGLCSYSGIISAQIATYHWFGNEIMYKCQKIIEVCYLLDWYKLSIRSQKTLMLIMERAKKPLIIKAYNFIFITIASFGVIIRWSYSIFALFKAKYN